MEITLEKLDKALKTERRKFKSDSSVNKSVVKALVANASSIVNTAPPLKNFIADNPTKGFEDHDFLEATKLIEKYFKAKCFQDREQYQKLVADGEIDPEILRSLTEKYKKEKSNTAEIKILAPNLNLRSSGDTLDQVNNYTNQFCAGFLDETESVWGMPQREKGFYYVWKNLIVHDPKFTGDSKLKSWLGSLPASPEESLSLALTVLGVAEDDKLEYLRLSLSSLPGWASYIKWREAHEHWDHFKYDVNLLEYLAVRLHLEIVFLKMFKSYVPRKEESVTITRQEKEGEIPVHVYQEALERTYQKQLTDIIETNLIGEANSQAVDKSLAQMIFCMDVRSEGIRRSIESVSTVETLGAAGFFGLPVSYKKYDEEFAEDTCPVLIKPVHKIEEMVHPKTLDKFADFQFTKSLNDLLIKTYKSLKTNVGTSFIFAEAAGILYMAMMLSKTFFSKMKVLFKDNNKKSKDKVYFDANVDLSASNPSGLTLKEQVFFSETALRLMGLTKNFSEFVIFTGHGSTTENNPYAAALDCGACAGQHGGDNAKAVAKILNNPEVRKEIANNGIHIPENTVFLGAEHDTTTDEIEIYDIDIVDPEKRQRIDMLKSKLGIAATINRESRELTNVSAKVNKKLHTGSVNTEELGIDEIDHDKIIFKSQDWSETRPEWGLTGNIAFFIGARGLLKGSDLRNRVFMHSYDWEGDTEGSALETIMSAPMVVTQCINGQYYFSSMDNVNFGSGSKITHNVVGDFGVIQGNSSDLQTGLTLQSIFKDDETLLYNPQRLCVYIQAPLSRVEDILDRNANLKNLFTRNWLYLKVICPIENKIITIN
ncbi:MAG: DUF2309 domain-containing protein [Candidatus Caenarcaniphilales bacterium]|nr:DUF2309 domain-containing protein [Candidatus Caenarcaniphilales bacterium]